MTNQIVDISECPPGTREEVAHERDGVQYMFRFTGRTEPHLLFKVHPDGTKTVLGLCKCRNHAKNFLIAILKLGR